MKDLIPADRPREKLLRHGAGSLGDNELVALVLGSGCRGTGALQVANGVLRARGGLHGLLRSTTEDLARIGGVGRAKAAQLLAAIELGRRTLVCAPGARLQLRTARDAAAYLMPTYSGRPVEQFGVILLDGKHRVMKTAIVASGTLNSTIVEPRDVFREALGAGASALVAFHNHPSGDPTPSREDEELTKRLHAGGLLIGVDVIDHVILGDTRYCSFREMGRL